MMNRGGKNSNEELDFHANSNTFSLPLVVRSEVNFLNLPFFALHLRGLKKRVETVYKHTEQRDGQKVELVWRVTANAKYGHPSPFDYRVSRAIDALIYETLEGYGYPLENPLQFSIYHLAELMKVKSQSGKLRREIKKSLKRLVATTVESTGSFYLKDSRRWIDDTFHLYERVRFRGEQINDARNTTLDGAIAETNYLWLGDFFLRNINTQYVRPLDYTYLADLDNIVASRLYEILSGKFFGLPRKEKYFQISYRTLCSILPMTPQRYISKAREKLKRAHDELIKTGFLSKVVFRKGKKDFVVIYHLGKRAERERRGGLTKQIAEPTAQGGS